jgi:putative phage-type endonuclease
MNTVSEIIDLIKSKINNSYASINDINKLAEEVYSHILAKYPEIPYFLITDIIGRMFNIKFEVNNNIDINLRQWDKILKIDEININKSQIIIKIPKKSQKIEEQFMTLYDTPQPEQRTKEWFDYRYNRITASDTATAIDCNPYESVESFICKKCDPNFPFLDNDFVFHGKKYEQIATSLYEHLYNSKVTEFGCVPSDKHKMLGASPDGISSKSTLDYKFNPKLGYMLEIKCPFVRPITNKGAIAGDICPYYYYCQVQQQLECCDLEYCDFIQCALVEYPDRETYLRDVNHKFVITEDVDGRTMNEDKAPVLMSKGYVLQFLPKVFEKKFDGDKHIYKGFFIYPPRLNMDQHQYDAWALNTISTWQKDYPEIAESHFFDRILYWKINNAHTVTIPRDKEWFAKVFPVLQDTWAKVCYYREHLEELPLIQELANKRKAFYKYKTEFQINNYEPNTLFLDENKPKKSIVSTFKPKSNYNKSNYSNKPMSSNYIKKAPAAKDDCEFIDD